MSITPVTNNSNITYSPLGDNNIIKLLEKQKMQLQEQIQKISESKMDPKMKQEKIKELTERINEIETQIRQKQMEKMKPDDEKVDSKNNTSYEDDKAQGEKTDGGINSEYMISAVSGYSDLKTIGKVRTELKGQLRIATHSGKNPEAGQEIAKKIEKLEGDIQKKSEKINDDLKKATKDGEKTEKQETENGTIKDTKGVQEDIKNVDKQNPVSNFTSDAAALQDENKDKSLNDGKSSEKAEKKEKETAPFQGRVVDIRI